MNLIPIQPRSKHLDWMERRDSFFRSNVQTLVSLVLIYQYLHMALRLLLILILSMTLKSDFFSNHYCQTKPILKQYRFWAHDL